MTAWARIRPGETFMNPLVQEKIAALQSICERHQVKRMALFGSAASGGFSPASSDLDFLVEFRPQTPAERAENYFGLQEDLENLLGVPVDLVEPDPIRNPYFRQSVEETQVLLYAAA